MSDLHDLGDLSDLDEGEMRTFPDLGEFGIVVCRVEGELRAVIDNCSHADRRLSEGRLRGPMLICPLHGAQFNVKTGKAETPPATVDLATYEVKIEGDDILVGLPNG